LREHANPHPATPSALAWALYRKAELVQEVPTADPCVSLRSAEQQMRIESFHMHH